MANGITHNEDNAKKSWLLEKAVALLQIVILVVMGVIYTDLREVRDSSIKQGTKQDRLVIDVQNVRLNVRTLNDTVQQLVGQNNGDK
jgi:sensor domain CHASE-containing protein